MSPLVADFHRQWYRRLGFPADRLLVSSFILSEPHWALRTRSVPFWVTFNAGPSLERLQTYLEQTEPYRDIRMMIFPHGTESVGLPSMDDWRRVLRGAREEAGFLGVNEETYPHHFSALARYHAEVAEIPDRHTLPEPVSLQDFESFCAENEGTYSARLLRN